MSGVGSEPLLYKTVGAVLEEAAARWGEREALVVPHQNIRWTYRQLDEAADRLAAGLVHLGLVPGDRIGIWSPNRYEWVVTQFATAKAGLILVTINPAYRTSELEYALNKVGCKALVLAPSFKTSDYAAMLEQIRPKVPTAAGRDPDRRCAARRLSALRRRGVVRDRRGSRACARAAPAAAAGRCDQHPVHQRHDRPAEGRDAVSSQHRQQRLLRRAADDVHRATIVCAFRCRSITASAW